MSSFKSAVLVSIFVVFSACHLDRHQQEMDGVAFEQLGDVADGSAVRLCGWFEAAYETCSLSPSRPAAMLADPRNIWVMPRSEVCALDRVVKRPVASWAVVTGKLRHGEGQGHLGGYSYSLCEADVQLIPEACP